MMIAPSAGSALTVETLVTSHEFVSVVCNGELSPASPACKRRPNSKNDSIEQTTKKKNQPTNSTDLTQNPKLLGLPFDYFARDLRYPTSSVISSRRCSVQLSSSPFETANTGRVLFLMRSGLRHRIAPYRIAFVTFFIGLNLQQFLGVIRSSNLGIDRTGQSIQQGGGAIGPFTGDDNSDSVHVLYTISGNDPDFIDEFLASMKSSLYNCPIDKGMGIHIMADDNAYQAILPHFNATKLEQWRTRNRVSIDTYNVERKKDGWKEIFERTTKFQLSTRHTIGAMFRLFAYEILPSNVDYVVYMDTDAGMLANLQDLWRLRNSSALFQWGEAKCSGFVLFNLRQMERQPFWDLVDRAYPKDGSSTMEHIDDQHILRVLAKEYPELVGFLPSEWDLHRADNFWRWKGDGSALLENRPKAGMVHMNGWTEGEGKIHNKFANTYEEYGSIFVAINFYGDHPWEWIRYMLESQLQDGTQGHQISLGYKTL